MLTRTMWSRSAPSATDSRKPCAATPTVRCLPRKSSAALVEMAKEVSADRGRARELGLSEDELAFYDAVATNEPAVHELGTDVLAQIARDLVQAVRADVTVDWTVREQVQARLRAKIKRLLAKYNYPPDAEQQAIDLVLEQTKTFAEEWAT